MRARSSIYPHKLHQHNAVVGVNDASHARTHADDLKAQHQHNTTARHNMAMRTDVRVGVGVIVRRPDGRFLLGERHGSFGVGKVAFPGGHLEFGESWDACARREVMEETGIALAEPTRHVATTNDVMVDDGKHYVTIFMLAEAPEDAEPQNLEPLKCKGWSWVSYAELRALPAERLFVPLINLLGDPSLCSTSFSL